MTVYLSLLVALVGALVYGFASNGKLAEIGRIMFFVGLLAFVLGLPGHALSVIR